MRRLALRPALSDAKVRGLAGESPDDRHFDRVIDDDTEAYDVEAGRLIFRLRKGVLPAAVLALAREVFGDIDKRMEPSWSRGAAAGHLRLERVQEFRPDVVAVLPSAKNPFKGR